MYPNPDGAKSENSRYRHKAEKALQKEMFKYGNDQN